MTRAAILALALVVGAQTIVLAFLTAIVFDQTVLINHLMERAPARPAAQRGVA